MIELDHLLIYEASRLITAANVHRLKQMIFLYEQAVLLHNKRWPAHEAYQRDYELALREFVVSHWQRRAS